MSQHPRIVLGVIQPPGASGSHGRGQRLWSVYFSLQPWRFEGEALQDTELTIFKQVPEKAVQDLTSTLRGYAVVRLRIGVPKDGRAELIDVVDVDEPDEELHRAALELQKPVTMDDDFFGTFTLDRDIDTWETTWQHDGKAVKISLSSESEIPVAVTICRDPNLFRDALEYAAAKLLPLKNDAWLEEDEEAVPAQEFRNRLTLTSISVSGDGEYTLYYDDGDLFWGHTVLVSGNLTAGPSDASIAG